MYLDIKSTVQNRKYIGDKKVAREGTESSEKEKEMTNSHENDEKISSLLESTFAKLNMNQKRAKVLTKCNDEHTLCRFLTCPNLREGCMLCEISVIPHDQSSYCEIFSTAYLLKI